MKKHSPPEIALNESDYYRFRSRLRHSEKKSYNSEKGEEMYLLKFLNDTLKATIPRRNGRPCSFAQAGLWHPMK